MLRILTLRVVITFMTILATLVACSSPRESSESPASDSDAFRDKQYLESLPNIILISIDTIRKSHMSTYGYPAETTKNISELATLGVRFDAAMVPLPATAPTHWSMMTGMYPVSHGMRYNFRVAENNWPTMAEYLRSSNYTTHAVVSSYVLDRKFGIARGFDTYDDTFPPEGALLVSEILQPDKSKGFDQRAEKATDKAIQVLQDAANRAYPFFLFVHYMDPHSPYLPPENYRDKQLGPRRSVPEYIQSQIDLYDADVLYTDHEIGRLLDTLDRLDLRDETLIILTGDHGEELWDHEELMEHNFNLYESQVATPLIFVWSGKLPEGTVIKENVSSIDILPTVLDIVKIVDQSQGSIQGISLYEAMKDGAALDNDRPLFMDRYPLHGAENEPQNAMYRKEPGRVIAKSGNQFGVRVDNLKFIQGSEGMGHELYDLANDPGEKNNLANEYPEEVLKLNGLIREWLESNEFSDSESQNTELTDIDQEALEALGYLQ